MTRKAKARKSPTTRRLRTLAPSARRRKPDALASLVASGAQALALPIEPAWQAGVKLNLQLLFIHAGLVDEFPLPDETEPAPVFRA
jgi:Protein of unknown function (DUF4089)